MNDVRLDKYPRGGEGRGGEGRGGDMCTKGGGRCSPVPLPLNAPSIPLYETVPVIEYWS